VFCSHRREANAFAVRRHPVQCASVTRLHSVPAPHFDLEKTLNSGQVFHWMRHGRGFVGAIAETPVYLEQVGGTIRVCRGQSKLVSHYLALDHPLLKILETFPSDPAIKVALEYGRGLRIIRQPPWECLATFLTSSLKQVQHIRAISLAIRNRFGRRLPWGEAEVFSYPEPEQVAEIPLEKLLECKLGFRAGYLLATAKMVVCLRSMRVRLSASCPVWEKRSPTACCCLPMTVWKRCR
jgi:N-glycosylase/DNA lyase